MVQGKEYEQYVAEYLNNNGFHGARLTPASGDYGADIICWKNDTDQKVAVQCKYYDKSVGIKAVQEVMGAKAYYKCDLAMAITNNTFSPQAKRLAATDNVILMEHIGIGTLIEDIAKRRMGEQVSQGVSELPEQATEPIHIVGYVVDEDLEPEEGDDVSGDGTVMPSGGADEEDQEEDDDEYYDGNDHGYYDDSVSLDNREENSSGIASIQMDLEKSDTDAVGDGIIEVEHESKQSFESDESSVLADKDCSDEVLVTAVDSVETVCLEEDGEEEGIEVERAEDSEAEGVISEVDTSLVPIGGFEASVVESKDMGGAENRDSAGKELKGKKHRRKFFILDLIWWAVFLLWSWDIIRVTISIYLVMEDQSLWGCIVLDIFLIGGPLLLRMIVLRIINMILWHIKQKSKRF